MIGHGLGPGISFWKCAFFGMSKAFKRWVIRKARDKDKVREAHNGAISIFALLWWVGVLGWPCRFI